MKPYVVIYRGEKGEVFEYEDDPLKVNDRLNELWGKFSERGPAQHKEARALLSSRLLAPSRGSWLE